MPARLAPRAEWPLALVLLAAFAALCAHGLAWDSPTVDEFYHLPVGLYTLETGDFMLFPANPPLVELLAALPVLALDPALETRLPGVRGACDYGVKVTDVQHLSGGEEEPGRDEKLKLDYFHHPPGTDTERKKLVGDACAGGDRRPGDGARAVELRETA